MARKTKEQVKKGIDEQRHKREKGKYLKDSVYGALDGIITTFAIVSGVVGASLSVKIILILGFANLVADGISMSVGNYLGTKSEQEYYEQEKRVEEWEIKNFRDIEVNEIREIYQKKGFKGKQLEDIVKKIISDKNLWVEEMMKDELGLMKDDKKPFKAGLATLIAFIIAGFVPLVAYILASIFPFFINYTFIISVVLTGLTIFGVGAARANFTGKNWFKQGLEMLLLGGAAAVVAYYIGFFLSKTIGV